MNVKNLIVSFLLLFIANMLGVMQGFAQSNQMVGMTSTGGLHQAGTIFKTDSVGNNEKVIQNFSQTVGAFPLYTSLIQATDGNLYGLTAGTDANVGGYGVLFQYNPVTAVYTAKYIFPSDESMGYLPETSLMQASDGNLYGVAIYGGANGLGTIFRYNITTSTFTKLFDFDDVLKGATPLGSLFQASDGNIYGSTNGGGVNEEGVFFKFNPSTLVFTKILDFDGLVHGGEGVGSLMQATDGNLYGMTGAGGAHNAGVIFQYNISTSTYTVLYNFATIAAGTGYNPTGTLVQTPDGNLYGMTFSGGANSDGVVFQYNIATNTYTDKADFTGSGLGNGKAPWGSLTLASDGNLYGLTYEGGTGDRGVLFQYNPTTSMLSRKVIFALGPNGNYPFGSLLQASDGFLYGMTQLGGTSNGGVLFQYNIASSTYTKELSFSEALNGAHPCGSLLLASDGTLYGMTEFGGTNNDGTLFQYDPNDAAFTKKVDFTGTAVGKLGSKPFGSLLQAADGFIYGMTSAGGTNDDGVLFQYKPATSIYIVKVTFSSANGISPYGSLIQASDGFIYGMTSAGGANSDGVLFQYKPATSAYAVKVAFGGAANGSHPYGTLVQASDGNIYGLTNDGGANGDGILFQYVPGGTNVTDKVDFAGTSNGSNPIGPLVQAHDGNLYGMTKAGGANGYGVLFQYNPSTSTLTKEVDFDSTTNGDAPHGYLLLGLDSNLYGTTSFGGANGDGVLFQYVPGATLITKKHDFTGTDGQETYYSGLIELSAPENLPVELLNFDAAVNEKTVELDWSTASEINNDFFAVERTGDGVVFDNVATIRGAGTSTSLHNYSVVDGNPLAGVSYYRLKQTDFDVKYHYSKMVAVSLEQNSKKLQILALNPAGTGAESSLHYFISGGSSEKMLNLEIRDMLGKSILSKSTEQSNGILNLSELAHGIYLFRVFDNTGSVVRKFIF